MDLLDDKNQL
jgi:hypothetical protein